MTGRTTVGQERRQVILTSARQLLRDHGWHAVAIDEIGAASGLTGPAVYRYFESKQALLTAAPRLAAEDLWSSLPPGDEPDLEALVDSHVRFVLDHADLVQLWYTEARHLAPDDRQAQRRLQRRYIEHWVTALTTRRPELDTAQALIMVRAAIGLVHSVAHSDERGDADDLHPVLVAMTHAALDTGLPPVTTTRTPTSAATKRGRR